jgi:hypothetical protein
MRRPHPGEGAKRPEARYHPEGAAVDATGVWHEGHASYPGRSVVLPRQRCATGVVRRQDGAAEDSRGRSSRHHQAGEGPNMKRRTEAGLSMVDAGAGDRTERFGARSEGSGRQPQGQDMGASNTAARREPSQPEAEMRLMAAIVSRENMMMAYQRVWRTKARRALIG